MNIRENLSLMSYRQQPFRPRGALCAGDGIDTHGAELCKQFSVKTPGVSELAGNLSGGNQQKVVVGRELDRKPRLLIAVHPSRRAGYWRDQVYPEPHCGGARPRRGGAAGFHRAG